MERSISFDRLAVQVRALKSRVGSVKFSFEGETLRGDPDETPESVRCTIAAVHYQCASSFSLSCFSLGCKTMTKSMHI